GRGMTFYGIAHLAAIAVSLDLLVRWRAARGQPGVVPARRHAARRRPAVVLTPRRQARGRPDVAPTPRDVPPDAVWTVNRRTTHALRREPVLQRGGRHRGVLLRAQAGARIARSPRAPDRARGRRQHRRDAREARRAGGARSPGPCL